MKKGIAFTIEVLVLLTALLLCGALLARTYGTAHTMSSDAKQLTTAVQLAQNAAELFAADKVQPSEQPFACYDAQKGALASTAENRDVAYAVYVLQDQPQTSGVQTVSIVVTASPAAGAKEIYRLETARYRPIQ